MYIKHYSSIHDGDCMLMTSWCQLVENDDVSCDRDCDDSDDDNDDDGD